MKIKCIKQYNLAMGSVDLNEEMAQPYIVEQKQVKKCYVKFFKRLLNVAVHNASTIYCTRNRTQPALQADLIKAPFLTHKPQVAFSAGPGRGHYTIHQKDLFGGTSLKVHATGKRKTPKKKCCLFITEEEGVDLLVS